MDNFELPTTPTSKSEANLMFGAAASNDRRTDDNVSHMIDIFHVFLHSNFHDSFMII